MLTGRGAREGRIKTNPLCELVLVAMATIITSHLGEQEQGGRGWEWWGGGGGVAIGGGCSESGTGPQA